MATVDTDIFTSKEDVGKNLYRKKTYYTLVIEQDVLADNKDDADNKFTENGIDHSKVGKDITETKDGVETYMVDVNYTDSGDTVFIGKVKYNDDDYDFDEAVENGDIHIDTLAMEDEPHQLTKIKLVEPEVKPLDDLQNALFGTKEESDVDTSINLENESKLGK